MKDGVTHLTLMLPPSPPYFCSSSCPRGCVEKLTRLVATQEGAEASLAARISPNSETPNKTVWNVWPAYGPVILELGPGRPSQVSLECRVRLVVVGERRRQQLFWGWLRTTKAKEQGQSPTGEQVGS